MTAALIPMEGHQKRLDKELEEGAAEDEVEVPYIKVQCCHYITFPAVAQSGEDQVQQDETNQETKNSLYPEGPILHEFHSDEELAETVTLSTKTMLADLTIMMVVQPESTNASCEPW